MMTTAIASAPAIAQVQLASADAADDATMDSDAIIVTATRRAVSLADVPINIAAIGAEQLREQRIDDIRSLGSFTPGVTIIDSGPRGAGNIVLRGISADDTSTGGANTDSALAIYLGEIPLYLDFKLLDMQRVEVLLGPQGTLYGLGTLAGAIRYIPNRPDTENWSVDLHSRVSARAESKDLGFVGDFTLNVPIIKDHVAFRTTSGYYYEPGFIDYPFVLQNPGTSLPQPGGTNLGTAAQQGSNLRRERDVNYERTYTTRNQLLLQANDDIKAYLTYAFQQTETGGRQANGAGVLGSGKYEGPWRYLEPQKRKAHLFAGELDINLGDIAQLVTATAYTKQDIDAIGDNTDLLLDLDYDYEQFPAFSSYAPSHSEYKQFNQEVRFVSTHGGPFSWVVGGFYNKFEVDNNRQEYVPGYYAAFPTGKPNPSFSRTRPDDLEYMSFVQTKTVEKALFGEVTFKPIDAWQITGGLRYYDYTAEATGGTEIPMTGGGVRRTPYPLVRFDPSRIRSGSTSSDGFVYKFNTSYKFRDGLLAYATYSTGYRIGGVNRVPPCIIPLPAGQNVCALPNELVFGPDKTRNKEIGLRASFFDNRLTVNLAGFIVDWSDVQVGSQTANGAVGITINAAEAKSQGIEFSGTAKLTDRLTLSATYAYLDAKLTADAPGLVTGLDASKGDRLPGSMKNSGSLIANYVQPVTEDGDVVLNWAVTYQGDVLTRVGERNFGETLPDYWLNRATVFYRTSQFEFGVFANNIFNVYAVTSIGQDYSKQTVNDGQYLRFYSQGVLTPRTVGFEGRIKF
ncbi:TonB-dependent receptor [Sandarakinorhabdus glacialis]|nr:TonB-dependent receptor [Polymorphobacter glacialis]